MSQCSTLNVKLSNSQIHNLKSGIKNGIEVTLKILLNIVGDSNDRNNFLHKLLLTNIQVSKFRKYTTTTAGLKWAGRCPK